MKGFLYPGRYRHFADCGHEGYQLPAPDINVYIQEGKGKNPRQCDLFLAFKNKLIHSYEAKRSDVKNKDAHCKVGIVIFHIHTLMYSAFYDILRYQEYLYQTSEKTAFDKKVAGLRM